MSSNPIVNELTAAFPETDQKMPVLFVGHGSPMNAIEDNRFSQDWLKTTGILPTPKAILCVSAHWQTSGTQVTAMPRPRTIHDFGGFPPALYAAQYPAPGSPTLAKVVAEQVTQTKVELDQKWGLDHGTWSVLIKMYPDATIPVIQLSLDYTQPPQAHYALAKDLAALRKRGVLIFGSGNIVHNLGVVNLGKEDFGFDWGIEFDQTIRDFIISGNHEPIVHYETLGRASRLSIPTNEHYLPLLYVLAQQEKDEPVHFFAEGLVYGSLSMRSLWIG